MQKNKISRYLLFIAILSLITILVFLIQQSYNRLIKPVQDLNSSELLKPINPTLDLSVFDTIESKTTYQPTATPAP